MRKLLLCVLLFGLVGCVGPDDPSVVKKNQTTLSNNGSIVGTLPDGRTIRRYQIAMGSTIHDHWVYVIEGTPSITVNRDVKSGKTTKNEVDVMIDGVMYTPVQK